MHAPTVCAVCLHLECCPTTEKGINYVHANLFEDGSSIECGQVDTGKAGLDQVVNDNVRR